MIGRRAELEVQPADDGRRHIVNLPPSEFQFGETLDQTAVLGLRTLARLGTDVLGKEKSCQVRNSGEVALTLLFAGRVFPLRHLTNDAASLVPSAFHRRRGAMLADGIPALTPVEAVLQDIDPVLRWQRPAKPRTPASHTISEGCSLSTMSC